MKDLLEEDLLKAMEELKRHEEEGKPFYAHVNINNLFAWIIELEDRIKKLESK